MLSDAVDIRLISGVLTDSRYRDQWPTLQSFMTRSRRFKDQPAKLLDLQYLMAVTLQQTKEARKRFKLELIQSQHGESEGIASLDQGIAVTKRVEYVIRQIADGIAWRTLRYDRAAVNQLALKRQTGGLDLQNALAEMSAAQQHVESTGAMVVMNDLTNLLTYGDFTAIKDASVTIAEVKSGQGSRKSGRASRQKRKLANQLEFLNAGIRQTANGIERMSRLDTRPRSHASAVHELIKTAKRTGSGHAQLSDSLAVNVLSVDLLTQMESADIVRSMRSPFSESKDADAFDSLSLLWQRFTPNVAPYSIFPFADDLCVDVMTGNLWLMTYFHWGNLERCLRRRGLLVRGPTEGEVPVDGLPVRKIQPRGFDAGLVVARHSRGPTWIISTAELARLIYEFLDEESFADAVEEILDRVGPQALWYSAFKNEAALWN